MLLPYGNRVRERVDLPRPRSDGKRFVWGDGTDYLPFNVGDAGKRYVYLTEGETDCMRLWQEVENHENVGVVGLPGVESWSDDWAPHFDGAEQVYVVLDNPSGYDDPAQLERGWQKVRGSLGLKARRVRLPNTVKDLCEFFDRFDYEAWKHLVKRAKDGQRHWSPLDLTKPPEPPDWLLKNVIAKGQVNVIVGPAWSGKSFWLDGLMTAMIQGQPFYNGLALNHHGKIYYVDEENPPSVPIWRLQKLGLDAEQLEVDKNIRYLSHAGVRLDKDGDRLLDECLWFEPDLVVFDSFDRLHRQEDSSINISAMFKDTLMPIAHHTGAAVVLLHHVTKDPRQGFVQRARGSAALGESADHGIIMEYDEEEQLHKLILGGSRSAGIVPGTTLATFKIKDVDDGIRIMDGDVVDEQVF